MGFIDYIKGVRSELTHVSWPARTQAIGYTILVIVLSVVMSILLGAFDFGFTYLIEVLVQTF